MHLYVGLCCQDCNNTQQDFKLQMRKHAISLYFNICKSEMKFFEINKKTDQIGPSGSEKAIDEQ